MVIASTAERASIAKAERLVFRVGLAAVGFFAVACLLPTALLMIIGLVMGAVSLADPWDLLVSSAGYPLFFPQSPWLLVLPAGTMIVLSIVTMPMGMGSDSAVNRPELYGASYIMGVLGFFVSVAFQGAPGTSETGVLVGLVASGVLIVAGVLFHLRNFFGSLDFVPWSWRPNLPEPEPAITNAATVASARAPRGASAPGSNAERALSVRVHYDILAWLQVPEAWPSPWRDWEYTDADDWATSWAAILAKRSHADAETELQIAAELRTIATSRAVDETRFVYTVDVELPLVFVRVHHEDTRPERSLKTLVAVDAPAGSAAATVEPLVAPALGEGIRSVRQESRGGSKKNGTLLVQYAWRHEGLDVRITAGTVPAARSAELLAAMDVFARATEVVAE
jgi:hypothetical protein